MIETIIKRTEDTKTYTIYATFPVEPMKQYLNERGIHCETSETGPLAAIRISVPLYDVYRTDAAIESMIYKFSRR